MGGEVDCIGRGHRTVGTRELAVIGDAARRAAREALEDPERLERPVHRALPHRDEPEP